MARSGIGLPAVMKAHVTGPKGPAKPGGAELARSASLSWHSPPCGSVLDVVVLVVIVVVVVAAVVVSTQPSSSLPSSQSRFPSHLYALGMHFMLAVHL